MRDQIAEMQLRVSAAAVHLHAVLAGGIIHHHLVVAAALVFLGLVAGENTVRMPVRCFRAVVDATGDNRSIAVAVEERNDHFLADARDVHSTVPSAGIRLGNTYPAGGVFVAGIQPVPVHLDFDAVQGVGEDLFVLRSHHGRRLHVHFRLVMLERTAERDGLALGFNRCHEEAFAAVRCFDGQRWIAGMLRTDRRDRLLQAMWEIRRAARDRQVVLHDPVDGDHRKLPILLATRTVLRMVLQFEPAAGVDTTHCTHAVETLRARFPLFHSHFRELITAVLLAVRVGACVFVHFGLLRQVTLGTQRRDVVPFGFDPVKRRLVVEGASSERRTLQRSRAATIARRHRFRCWCPSGRTPPFAAKAVAG